MRVLMFGWEFPPHNSGGLGVACRGLTIALADAGVQVTFVLPRPQDVPDEHLDVIFPPKEKVRGRFVNSLLSPYLTASLYEQLRMGIHGGFAHDLFIEVLRYAEAAEEIALTEHCDVIHAHDWLAFPAGLAAKRATGKPLILHVHLPSVDQGATLGFDDRVFAIEKQAFEGADAIIAISHRVRELLEREYGIPREKIYVIHNGLLREHEDYVPVRVKPDGGAVALYMGRLTLHKGPDIFLRAAEIVIRHNPKFRFIIAGAGELERQLLYHAAAVGLGKHVFFAGFARGGERRALLHAADMLVMPSVAEPFGLIALEAAAEGIPTIVSKQSGVREVLPSALVADFWDVELLAQYMLAIAAYRPLHDTMSVNGAREAEQSTWDVSAKRCIALYTACVTAS
jgi:glycosyltransferase involved in cell wall biosynthesis